MIGKTFHTDMADTHALWIFPFASLVLRHPTARAPRAQARPTAKFSDPPTRRNLAASSWAHVQARGSQPGLVGARQVREDADSRHAQEVPVRGSSQVRVSEYGTKCTPHTHYVRTRASRSSVRVAF